MNRRRFLKLLGGAAVASTMPKIPLADVAPAVDVSKVTIGEYADYVSFSTIHTDLMINPLFASQLKEISYRLALSLDNLQQLTDST